MLEELQASNLIDRYPWSPLTHAQSFTQLVRFIQADPHLVDIRQIAYVLATCRHETWYTYAPVEERGRGAGRPYGIPDPETGQIYFGRGFVQLTWRDNYARFGAELHEDLLHHPDKALVPEIAYRVTSFGMRYGAFTGKRLGEYIADGRADYVEARRIVNVLDQAEVIAGYARAFEAVLTGQFNSLV